LRPRCVNSGGEPSRLYYDGQLRLDCPVEIPDRPMWQVRCGEILAMADSVHRVIRCRVLKLTGKRMPLLPFEPLAGNPQSALHLTVCQELPAKERFEPVLQKQMAIDADRIVPMLPRHSLTVVERDAGQKKSQRWPDVVLRAAKQCRRTVLPEFAEITPFTGILERSCGGPRLLLNAGDASLLQLQALPSTPVTAATLLAGPEDGLSSLEREARHWPDLPRCGSVRVSCAPKPRPLSPRQCCNLPLAI